MNVHLIQRVWSEPTGFGRSEYRTDLQPSRGYFTSVEQAQPTLDDLNADYRARYQEQESERLAAAVRNGESDIVMKPSEASDFLPRFVLTEIPPALTTPDDKETAWTS